MTHLLALATGNFLRYGKVLLVEASMGHQRLGLCNFKIFSKNKFETVFNQKIKMPTLHAYKLFNNSLKSAFKFFEKPKTIVSTEFLRVITISCFYFGKN